MVIVHSGDRYIDGLGQEIRNAYLQAVPFIHDDLELKYCTWWSFSEISYSYMACNSLPLLN